MFETFIMITLLAIGLSQLIPDPEKTPDEKNGRKKSLAVTLRSDTGAGRASSRYRAAGRYRCQAHRARTVPNSPGGTGRLKKKPCIW